MLLMQFEIRKRHLKLDLVKSKLNFTNYRKSTSVHWKVSRTSRTHNDTHSATKGREDVSGAARSNKVTIVEQANPKKL